MSSQYPSRHALFTTKDSDGASNAEKTTKHKNSIPAYPNILTWRAVEDGTYVGGGHANNPYSVSTNNVTPRTPSPERPTVQQFYYPQTIRQLEKANTVRRSPNSSLYPFSEDIESELTSSQWKIQRRALPIAKGRRRMSTPASLSNDSQREWEDLAIEGSALNRAVVILQGELEDQVLESLQTCLQLMGFEETNILHRPHGKISKEEIESRAASLVDGLAPCSNLLLMICEKDYGCIELDPDFLDKRIYSPVAKYNQKQDKHFMERVAKSNIGEFDSQRFEGVTLHVIIDGVDVHPLKHILRLDLGTGAKDVMKSKWKDHKAHQDSNKSILEGSMGHGDVVQFWVSRDMHGYAPFLLLNAMLCICLEEPELPYQILLLRLKTILHKTLEASLSQNPFGQGNCRKGIRAIGGIAVHTCAFLIKKLACYLSERALENQRKQSERDIYDGNYVLSSIDKFDPNLSLQLNWTY